MAMSDGLYLLPDGWEWQLWQDIVNVKNGKDYKAVLNKNGKYPVYGSGGVMGNADEYLCNENSVVIGRKGTINNPLFVTEKFWNIDTAFGLEANQNVLEPKFLYYFCLTFDFKQLNTSTTLPSLTKSNLQKISMPLPPLTEQKRIVEKLDGLFAKIDKAIGLLDESISSASALLPSALNEVFGELSEKNKKLKLNELCKKITDGTHYTPKYTEAGVPFLSVKDISGGKIDFSNTRYISAEEHKVLSTRCNVEKNDVLYTKVGTTGIAKVVDVDNDFSIFVSIALLKPRLEIIKSEYLEYILNSPSCYEQAQSRTRGVANRNLVLKDIKEITLPLPPLNIQVHTVEHLDAVREKSEWLTAKLKTQRDELVALKASLLERAFKGEL